MGIHTWPIKLILILMFTIFDADKLIRGSFVLDVLYLDIDHSGGKVRGSLELVLCGPYSPIVLKYFK